MKEKDVDKKLLKDVIAEVSGLFSKLKGSNHSRRGNKTELYGTMDGENVIVTITLHQYTPMEKYGKKGRQYESTRTKKGKKGKPDEVKKVTRYEMTPAEMKFITDCYVYNHLTQEQINILSGIPQPVIFRFIKHKKLKPNYEKIPKSERKYDMDFDNPLDLDMFTKKKY